MKKKYDFKNAKRGAVVATPPGKTRVTIRLDNAVLDWFRKDIDEAGGGRIWQLTDARNGSTPCVGAVVQLVRLDIPSDACRHRDRDHVPTGTLNSILKAAGLENKQ